MKRFMVLMIAIAALVATGLTAAVAEDVSADAAPTPQSPIVWKGNGTDGGLCSQVLEDSSVTPGDQVWLFILTSPSGSSWTLDASFDDGTDVTGVLPSKVVGSIHFEVTTGVGAKLLSASATNGKTNSVLTVSHCTANGEAPPPPEGTGTLSVVKTVLPLPAGVTGVNLPSSYTAHVHCSDGETTIDQDVTLPGAGGAGDPALIDGIPFGSTCTVVETTVLPPLSAVTYSVNGEDSTGVVDVTGIVVDEEQPDVEVDVTNDFTAVQGEVVTKPIAPVADPVVVSPAFTG